MSHLIKFVIIPFACQTWLVAVRSFKIAPNLNLSFQKTHQQDIYGSHNNQQNSIFFQNCNIPVIDKRERTKSHATKSYRYKHQPLQMGLFDFFQSRENDFVKLEETSTFGPGPVVILYNVPEGILDEEIRDMIDDGITSRRSGQVKFIRLNSSDLDSMGDMTVQQVLEGAMSSKLVQSSTKSSTSSNNPSIMEPYVPILYFSGVSSPEMMETYKILSKEIYEESGGMANAACAKAVEPAMMKSFSQLIEEISGDHTDAMRSSLTE